MAVTINGDTGIDKIQDGSIVTSDFASTVPLGTKNLIINGDMRIAQRGTSESGITNASSYLLDRFIFSNSNIGTWTQSQDSDVPSGQGFVKSIKLECTATDTPTASETLSVQHRIEAQNLQNLKYGTSNAEDCTVSFWVKSNKTGTYTFSIYQFDGTAQGISKEYTIDSADTWEKKTIIIEGNTGNGIDNDNGAGFGLYWVLSVGSDRYSSPLQTSWGAFNTNAFASSSQVNLADSTSNYINITGVQLEIGDVATPFQHMPFDAELKRCSRYYQKTFRYSYAPYTEDNENRMYYTAMANASTVIGNPGVRPIYQEGKMRTAPTITLYDTLGNSGKLTYTRAGQPASTNITATVDQVGENAFRLSTSSASSLTAGQAVILLFYYTADAEL